MKPIDEAWEKFAHDYETPDICKAIEDWLNEHYPEVEWTVESDGSKTIVTAVFKNPSEETFYRLKWT